MTSFLQSVFALTILIHSISRTVNAAAVNESLSNLPTDSSIDQRNALLPGSGCYSCLGIKNSLNAQGITAASGEYPIWIPRLNSYITVYCEMGLGLNGLSGYTFIRPFDLPKLIDSDIQGLISDRTSLLMRYRHTDGSQPYGVLQQLSQFSGTPIKVLLNSWTDNNPLNVFDFGGIPYLFFGFLPPASPPSGLRVNGISVSFAPCNGVGNPRSYITLFPDFRELTTSPYYPNPYTFINTFFSQFKPNPSRRVMNSEYFTFMEMFHGRATNAPFCGGYTQTDGRSSIKDILSAAIGFR